MSQRDVFGSQAPTYVLPSTLGAIGEVLTVGPAATPNALVWAAGGSTTGIETIENIHPDGNGNFELYQGAGITIVGSGNGLVITNNIPGFQLSASGTLPLTGNDDIPTINVPYTVYNSGVSPNVISTMQMGLSSTTTVGDTPTNIAWFQQLPFFPLYLQAGSCYGTNPAEGGEPFEFVYIITTDGMLTIKVHGPSYPVSGTSISLYGISITFPVT